jgi:hypothetical protein
LGVDRAYACANPFWGDFGEFSENVAVLLAKETSKPGNEVDLCQLFDAVQGVGFARPTI